MTGYSPHDIEKEVQAYWKKNGIIEKIVELDKKKPKFYLLDGPPYVNGMPHVGHIKTTVLKDLWGKFKQMNGFSVWWQPGFDCGGLPIENAVEKKLGIEGKNEIMEKVGADKFIAECKALAKGNEPVWLELYKKIAAWRGWVEPYLTSDNAYRESGWWTIKNMYENGQLFEGQKPGFWCPSCQTVLSGYEVTDSYKNVEDPSIFIKFPVRGYDKAGSSAASRSAKESVSDTSAASRSA
jgi:isoleucyl-tRNA synthetase